MPDFSGIPRSSEKPGGLSEASHPQPMVPHGRATRQIPCAVRIRLSIGPRFDIRKSGWYPIESRPNLSLQQFRPPMPATETTEGRQPRPARSPTVTLSGASVRQERETIDAALAESHSRISGLRRGSKARASDADPRLKTQALGNQQIDSLTDSIAVTRVIAHVFLTIQEFL